jgi:hypothetical protein
VSRTERDEIIVAILTGTISSLIGSAVYKMVVPEGTGGTIASQIGAAGVNAGLIPQAAGGVDPNNPRTWLFG